jgi:N-acetylmuramoyl-L-alanine amidase
MDSPRFLLLSLLVVSAGAAEPLRVVIDPGHGGTNLGARGVLDHVYEKELTLALSRRVRDALLVRSISATLTRDDDRYLPLGARARAAGGADVFVSLHLNASPRRDQRGFETYVHGDGPLLEVEAGAPAPAGALSAILLDLKREALQAESLHLAALVQRHLARTRGASGDRGVKRAPLDVLREARSAAVLIEVAFIDHPDEGREVLDAGVQHAIADRIADALDAFQVRETAARARGVRLAGR